MIKKATTTIIVDLHLVQISEGVNGQIGGKKKNAIVEVTTGKDDIPQAAIVVIEVGKGK